MTERRTGKAVNELLAAARGTTSSVPPGYEEYAIDWGRLTPTEVAVVCEFADALREIRLMEQDLLELGTSGYIRLMTDALRRQNAERSGWLR